MKTRVTIAMILFSCFTLVFAGTTWADSYNAKRYSHYSGGNSHSGWNHHPPSHWNDHHYRPPGKNDHYRGYQRNCPSDKKWHRKSPHDKGPVCKHPANGRYHCERCAYPPIKNGRYFGSSFSDTAFSFAFAIVERR